MQGAKVIEVSNTDEKYYLAYSDSGQKQEEYKALLKANGFMEKGGLTLKPENVTSSTGGIVTTTFKRAECPWYQKEDINVVFGRVEDAFIVRIYKGKIDEFSAGGIRAFFAIINKD